MVAKKSRERTITFFEIVKIDGTKTKRFDHSNWQSIFRNLRAKPLSKRVHKGPERTLIGDFLDVDGSLHLKLMRVRDESAWLEIYDSSAGTVSDLEIDEKQDLLETSIVCFLPFGNVIGVIQGSIAAPGATGVAEWINGLGFIGKDRVAATVMMSTEAVAKLNSSSEAFRLEARVHTSKAAALESKGSTLGKALTTIKQEYGEMKVTVILQASRAKGKANSEARASLRKETKVLESLDGGVTKLKAKLMYYDGDGSSSEEVDFLHGRVTAKRDIPTTAEDGSPIRNESAVSAILAVADEHEDELRTIVKR